jgi:hypothetical protein
MAFVALRLEYQGKESDGNSWISTKKECPS